MPILNSNTLEFFSRSPEQTRRIGIRLGSSLQAGDVICLSGELGAGKTTLVQGIARGEKMDWILQKATELGVTRLVPVVTERTEVKLDEDRAGRRLAHWQQVIASACEQCGRNRLPRLDAPQRLPTWLAQLGDTPGARLALLPEGTQALRSLGALADGAILVVGPEGGFSDHDEAALRQAGFAGLRLGPRILRTETAGLAALAALQAVAGDLS